MTKSNQEKADEWVETVDALALGSKYDEDKYIKVDLSLIPWKVLSRGTDQCPIRDVAKAIHNILNDVSLTTFSVPVIQSMFDLALKQARLTDLAVSLGYGEVKYDRNNWRQGFGGDWRRFLRACLRHCMAYLHGECCDGYALDGYARGNSHKGAILFSLMVAMQELESSGLCQADEEAYLQETLTKSK